VLHCSFFLKGDYMNKIFITVFTALSLIGVGLFYSRMMHDKNVQPTYLYKIVSVEDWAASKDQERVKLSVMDDAFIHLATAEQLDKIIAKFWAHVPEVVILKLEVAGVPGELKYEQNPGGENKYYHLYNGFIPRAAVRDVVIRRVNNSLLKV